MADLIPFPSSLSDLRQGGGPPDNGGMEARVAKLEELSRITHDRLIRIEAKQDEFIKYYATKADLSNAKNSIIMWVVGSIFLAQLLPALLKVFHIAP